MKRLKAWETNNQIPHHPVLISNASPWILANIVTNNQNKTSLIVEMLHKNLKSGYSAC